MGNYAYMAEFEGETPKLELNDGYVCGVVKCIKSCIKQSQDFDGKVKFVKGKKYILTYMHTGDDEVYMREMNLIPLPYAMQEKDVVGKTKCFEYLKENN